MERSAIPAIAPADADQAEGVPAIQMPIPVPVETPMLAAAVGEGRLPPVADRLPKAPRVVDLAAMGREPSASPAAPGAC